MATILVADDNRANRAPPLLESAGNNVVRGRRAWRARAQEARPSS